MVITYRLKYACTVFILIILGISSRKFTSQLPFFIADNAGDILWASMVYFVFRSLFINKSLPWAFAGSLTFSFLIECSQLYQADWINVIRHTTLGALILGKGFLLIDLFRYFLGISIACLADSSILKYVSGRLTY